jgi:predicted house-cleaning noncanonical NTP pyrophosphatase (MazG superfamily)
VEFEKGILKDRMKYSLEVFLRNPKEETAADLLEVFNNTCDFYGIDMVILDHLRKKKRLSGRGFWKEE